MKIKKAIALTAAVVSLLSMASCVTIKVDVPACNIPAISNLYDPNNSGGSGNDAPASETPVETQAPSQEATAAGEQAATETPATQAQNNSETPATPATQAQNNAETPAAQETAASENKTETSTKAAETPATPETPATSANASNTANAKPSTKEEIINYYVTAYNKIATDAKKVTRTYDNTTNYNNIIKIGDNEKIKSLCESLMNQFMKPNSEVLTKTASDLPPVGVTKLSISPSQISSAVCNDKGTYYEVILKSTGTDSNYEVDSEAGKGSAGVVGPLLRTEDVSGAAGSLIKFEGLHAKYATCTVTAKIDKASGHITDFDFNSPCILHFDKVTALVVVKVENCDLGLLFEQKWSVAY